MRKVIIVCAAVLALTSINAFAGGSKRPAVPWPPAIDMAVEVAQESQR